jgi:hypothetical protein
MVRIEDARWPGWLRGNRPNLASRLCSADLDHEAALALLEEWRSMLPATGEVGNVLICMSNQANSLIALSRFPEAAAISRAIIERCRQMGGNDVTLGFAGLHLLVATTGTNRLAEARVALRESLPNWRRCGLVPFFCTHVALLEAKQGRFAAAARLAGANDAYHRQAGIERSVNIERARTRVMQSLDDAGVGRDDVARWMAEGAALDLDGLIALCAAAAA